MASRKAKWDACGSRGPHSKTYDLRRTTGSTGFTFVEILLTLVILSVSAAPLMQLFSTAVEQAGTVDEMRAALDLGREEVEKIKNLALTEEQIKGLGNVVNPPIVLNRTLWYTARVVDRETTPIRVTVYVFRDSLNTSPVITLVTVVSK